MLRVQGEKKFQLGAILTCHTMDGEAYTIGKAIRPLFADPVTYAIGKEYFCSYCVAWLDFYSTLLLYLYSLHTLVCVFKLFFLNVLLLYIINLLIN